MLILVPNTEGGSKESALNMSNKKEEPVMGIPYAAPYQASAPAPAHMQQQYYVGQNPYQAGALPPNAILGDPKGIPIQQTIYRDTPAPFNCLHCGHTALTTVRNSWIMSI